MLFTAIYLSILLCSW